MNIKLGAKVRQKTFKPKKEACKNLFLHPYLISGADGLYVALQGTHNK